MTDHETVLYLSSDELRTLRDALDSTVGRHYCLNNISEARRYNKLRHRIEDFCDREPLALAKIESGIIKVEQETGG